MHNETLLIVLALVIAFHCIRPKPGIKPFNTWSYVLSVATTALTALVYGSFLLCGCYVYLAIDTHDSFYSLMALLMAIVVLVLQILLANLYMYIESYSYRKVPTCTR